MDIESVVLVISVILLFVIGYVAVGVLIPDPRKIRKRRNRPVSYTHLTLPTNSRV